MRSLRENLVQLCEEVGPGLTFTHSHAGNKETLEVLGYIIHCEC